MKGAGCGQGGSSGRGAHQGWFRQTKTELVQTKTRQLHFAWLNHSSPFAKLFEGHSSHCNGIASSLSALPHSPACIVRKWARDAHDLHTCTWSHDATCASATNGMILHSAGSTAKGFTEIDVAYIRANEEGHAAHNKVYLRLAAVTPNFSATSVGSNATRAYALRCRRL